MDKGVIIFLAILILLFAITVFTRNRKRKQVEKFFLELAQKNDCIISNYQCWNHLQIGIDQNAGILFFIRLNKDQDNTRLVDLSVVKNIKVLKVQRDINTSNGRYVSINRIDLIFSLWDRTEISLCFYDSSYDSPTLQGELQLAEKWKDIANTWISENKNLFKNTIYEK